MHRLSFPIPSLIPPLTLRPHIQKLDSTPSRAIEHLAHLLDGKAFGLRDIEEDEIHNRNQYTHIDEVVSPGNLAERHGIHKLIEAHGNRLRHPKDTGAFCPEMTGPYLVDVENGNRRESNDVATKKQEEKDNDCVSSGS